MSWLSRAAGIPVGIIRAGTFIAASFLVLQPAPGASALTHSTNADAELTTNSTGRLYFLNTRKRQVMTVKPDGSDLRVLADTAGMPDGIAVDSASARIYWTNMTTFRPDWRNRQRTGHRDWMARFGAGSLQRASLKGSNVTTVVPSGGTYRPKQMTIDLKDKKLYWSDREGMRVMRSNLDGSDVQTLVQTGKRVAGERGDQKDYCVGIALDLAHGEMYWTQRGGRSNDGSIRRASMYLPRGEEPAHRTDIQVLFDHLPEPVDLALDLKRRVMYWTSDGGYGAGADTVSRAPMDPPAGYNPAHRSDRQILVSGLRGGIGISLDLNRGRMYFTDLGGHVYSAKLDGSDEKTLLSDMGSITGITYVAAQQ